MSLRARIKDEERGVAVVVVMGVLLVVSMLALAVAGTADRTNHSSVRDTNAKRALAAAETGLNVARFEVSDNVANDAACVPGTCAWTVPQSDGNGATYTYRVSPVLHTPQGVGYTCVNRIGTVPQGVRERCVTAVGEVNGIRRRVQARMVENRAAPLFPFPGMLGLNRVEINQTRVVGTVGSNVNVHLSGGDTRLENPGTIFLGERAGVDATLTWLGAPAPAPSQQQHVPEYKVDPIDEWYSDALRNNSITEPAVAPWVDSGRNMHVGPDRTITLTSGKSYNLCSLRLDARTKLVVPATATEPVRIFIDSATRPSSLPGVTDYSASGCGVPLAVSLDLRSEASLVNNTGKASMLQVYVYSGNIVFNASAQFVGTLWAPQSHVEFNAGGGLKGAMVASSIKFNNSDPGFVSDDDANSVTGRWDGRYERNAWRECPANGVCP